MGGQRKFGRALAVVVAVLVVWLLVRGGHGASGPAGDAAHPQPSGTTASGATAAGTATPTAGTPTAAAPTGPTTGTGYDPAQFAAPVRKHAAAAGITPRLLMAILYNESYKPHDPALERAWQRLKPDSAFGIANMHRAAFDEAKRGQDFAARSWDELPDDPDLAIDAAAWYLRDLADQLPAHWSGPYTKDELLALGYNTGPGNMLAFARGVTPGPAASSYLEQLRGNLPKADTALAATG